MPSLSMAGQLDFRKKEATGDHTIRAMRSRLDDANFQTRGCSIIADWNINAIKVTEFGEAAAHLAVIAAMHAHQQIQELQQFGCAALANLCENAPNLIPAVADAGAVKVVTAAMKTHPNNPLVQHRACRALVTLAPLYTMPITEFGGHRRTVVAMRQFPDHTEVQEWGLKLCEVLAGNHDCRVLLAEFEVHVVAVEAMARFLDNPVVHAAGSLTLLAMVAHEGAREAGKARGAASLALQGMAQMPTEAAVQLNASKVILRLVTPEDQATAAQTTQMEQICSELAGASGVRVVVEAMVAAGAASEMETIGWQCICRLGLSGPDRAALLGMYVEMDTLSWVLAALKAFPQEIVLLQHGCLAVHSLVTAGGSTAQKMAVRAGAHSAVLQTMLDAPADLLLQTRGCSALSCLVQQSWDAQVQVVSEGGAKLALAAMETFPDDGDLIISACHVLTRLGEHANQKRVVCASGETPEILKSVFANHRDNHDVVVAASNLVGCLAAEPINAEPLLAARVHQDIAELLNDGRHRFSTVVAVSACDTISSFCRREAAKVAPLMLEVGAHEAALSVLRTHREDAAVVRSALWAVGSIGCGEQWFDETDSAIYRFDETFADFSRTRDGSSLRVVATAQAYLNGETCHAAGITLNKVEPDLATLGAIQHAAMVAIGALGRSKRGARDLVQEGAVEVIVAAMEAHPMNHGVCVKGCSALHALATNCDEISSLIDFKAGEVVLKTMSRFLMDVPMQHAGLQALVVLAADEKSCQALFDLNIVQVVLAAMRSHPAAAEVQFFGCMVVVAMSKLRDFSLLFASEGGMETIVCATGAHIENADVQDQCWWALIVLALLAENRDITLATKSNTAVLQRMVEQASDNGVQLYGVRAITALAADSERAKHILLAEGAHAIAVKALRTHLTDQGISLHGSRALEKLYTGKPPLAPCELHTRYPPAPDSLVVEYQAGCEALVNTMQQHRNDVEVQVSATNALTKYAAIDKECCNIAVSCGAVSVVLAAMEGFIGHSAMQTAAMHFVKTIARVSSGRVEWTSGRGMPAMVLSMSSHPTDVALLTVGCDAVTAINQDGISQTHQRELLVHEQIVAALELHIAEEGLQRAGMEALSSLSQTVHNLGPLVAAGGLNCALSTLQAHHTNGAARAACEAIAAMLPTYEKSDALSAGACLSLPL